MFGEEMLFYDRRDKFASAFMHNLSIHRMLLYSSRERRTFQSWKRCADHAGNLSHLELTALLQVQTAQVPDAIW